MALLLFFLFILTAVVFLPQYVVIILVLNLFAGLFLSLMQILTALLPHSIPKRKVLTNEPFVSIFVPAYNEPPAILMQTLETLSQLQYSNYEVLIIDNNTKDVSVWGPVRAFTRTLGGRFRFIHRDVLSGFKAGALNYLLEHAVNPESRFVAVLDADYLVKPNFLAVALTYFSDEEVALVQFPQRYRNANNDNQPIADEYCHFFSIYMNMANNFDCVPSTGTVSVYALAALRKIRGFRGESLTEDADVGLRLYGAGFRGVYIDQPMGYGLMPYDLEAYRKQKWRWAFGNAQSLVTLFSLIGKIRFRTWIGFFSHLTAWHHFHFLSFATLAAFPIILYPSIVITSAHWEALIIASLTILSTMAAKMILFLVTFWKRKKPLSRAVHAFVVHMGMTLIYSEAWMAFVFRTKLGFERTNKFLLVKMPSLLKNTYGELFLGVWFLLGSVVAVLLGELAMVMAFFLAASSLFAIYYVYVKLLPTKEYSKTILSPYEKKYAPFMLK